MPGAGSEGATFYSLQPPPGRVEGGWAGAALASAATARGEVTAATASHFGRFLASEWGALRLRVTT